MGLSMAAKKHATATAAEMHKLMASAKPVDSESAEKSEKLVKDLEMATKEIGELKAQLKAGGGGGGGGGAGGAAPSLLRPSVRRVAHADHRATGARRGAS